MTKSIISKIFKYLLFTTLSIAVLITVVLQLPGLSPKKANAQVPCTSTGSFYTALTSFRNWVVYAPPRPFNPSINIYPTEVDIQNSLKRLRQEGFCHIVTYSLDGTLSQVPRIARSVGFSKVIAGLYWNDRAQLDRERTAALSQRSYIDAYVVGNEGLGTATLPARYTISELRTEISRLKSETGKPVTTSEVIGNYNNDVLALGDWVFPNIHPWWAGIYDTQKAADYVESNFLSLENRSSKQVIVKEVWWPTAGDNPAANETNQTDFFTRLSKAPVKFIWGEAYDQYWKKEPGNVGSHWGLHRDNGEPKPIISALKSVYSGAYPVNPYAIGRTLYNDGTTAKSGRSGTIISAYATGAYASTEFRLVSGKGGKYDGPCRFDPQPINTTLRYSSSTGNIETTSGPVNRHSGRWQICFYEVYRGTVGRSATMPVWFTIP